MNTGNKQHSHLPLPNGWFAVAFSKDLGPGEVKPLKYFDEDLVLFRTRGGEARVLDAYCAHLGAHLGEGGRVTGEGIRCPFHGWVYEGATGACSEIPYCKKIPTRARVRAWETIERNHMIFVWRHAEGKPPEWDFPDLPEFENPEWTEPRFLELEVPVHMQDMAENNCDPVHFMYVHSSTTLGKPTIEFGEDGRFFRVWDKDIKQTPLGEFETELIRDTWQLGISSVRTEGIPGAGLLMFSSTTPIDAENSMSRWVFTVTRNLVDLAGEEWINGLSTGVLQDMRIWKNKIHRARPVLCEADEHLAHFRRWVKQFYSEPA